MAHYFFSRPLFILFVEEHIIWAGGSWERYHLEDRINGFQIRFFKDPWFPRPYSFRPVTIRNDREIIRRSLMLSLGL